MAKPDGICDVHILMQAVEKAGCKRIPGAIGALDYV